MSMEERAWEPIDTMWLSPSYHEQGEVSPVSDLPALPNDRRVHARVEWGNEEPVIHVWAPPTMYPDQIRVALEYFIFMTTLDERRPVQIRPEELTPDAPILPVEAYQNPSEARISYTLAYSDPRWVSSFAALPALQDRLERPIPADILSPGARVIAVNQETGAMTVSLPVDGSCDTVSRNAYAVFQDVHPINDLLIRSPFDQDDRLCQLHSITQAHVDRLIDAAYWQGDEIASVGALASVLALIGAVAYLRFFRKPAWKKPTAHANPARPAAPAPEPQQEPAPHIQPPAPPVLAHRRETTAHPTPSRPDGQSGPSVVGTVVQEWLARLQGIAKQTHPDHAENVRAVADALAKARDDVLP